MLHTIINPMSAEPTIGRDGRYHVFYVTTNAINRKVYYGKHSTDELSDGYVGSGKHLLRSVEKYGREQFTRHDLAFFECAEEAFEAEALLIGIEEMQSDMIMNMVAGGYGAGVGELNHMFGRVGRLHPNFGRDFSWVIQKLTPEGRERIIADKRGKVSVRYEDGTCALLPQGHSDIVSGKAVFVCAGRTLSQESRNKIAEGNLGRKASEETRAKMRESATGNQHALGHRHTDDTKAKMSSSHKGKTIPEETRAKISAKNRGKRRSEECAKAAAERLNGTTYACPHCGVSAAKGNAMRWHFDNCKKKGG